jgi:hypothetical protein
MFVTGFISVALNVAFNSTPVQNLYVELGGKIIWVLESTAFNIMQNYRDRQMIKAFFTSTKLSSTASATLDSGDTISTAKISRKSEML